MGSADRPDSAGAEEAKGSSAERPSASATRPARRLFKVRPVSTPVPTRASAASSTKSKGRTDGPVERSDAGAAVPSTASDPFLRPPCEDDDGYDPFSDRPPAPEPIYQEDPWK